MLQRAWFDVRYAARLLARSPGSTIVLLMSLAIGIGVNTAVFSVADGVLFRPLPYDQPERLIMLVPVGRSTYGSIPLPEVRTIRSFCRTLEGVAFSQIGSTNVLLTNEHAYRLRNEAISEDFLRVLHVQPILGRGFLPEEHRTERPSAVLLTYSFWQRHFGRNADVLGKRLLVGADSVEVVGVLPAGFVFPQSINTPPEILTPLYSPKQAEANERVFLPIGRLNANVSIEPGQHRRPLALL